MGEKLAKRSEMNAKYKWIMEDIYDNDTKWQTEFEEVKVLLEEVKKFKGQLGKSDKHLLDFLRFNDKISQKLERVYVYANQRYHEDTTNAYYQNLADKAGTIMVAATSASSFSTPEILSISSEKIEEYFEKNVDLRVYRRYLENILRKKSHVLSTEIEELLANAEELGEAPGNIFSMFNNADIKFPEIKDKDGNLVEISHGKYSSFLQSEDRRVRKDAFQGVYATYKKFQNTLAATYSSNVKKESFFAKARKYQSSMEMALDDSNVPVGVYENLIDAVHDNLPLMHRYVSLRKRILMVEDLHMYDLYTPMVSKVDMKISYDEATNIVKKALVPLGDEYLRILEEGFSNGWIDVYENEGKRSGAYSWGAYGTHPYVLLNYQDNLNNVFTLAHEMGHALHSYYSDRAQPYIYAGYKIFVAEVASTCNEALLMHYLLENTEDKKQKAYLINYYLEQFRTTLYRQTMFAEFEMLTHKMVEDGEALTAEKLCEMYHSLNEQYFGKDIVIDPEIDMEWARIPHFYKDFYVYQYATGYSAAIALSRKILKEGKSAVDDYVNEFLSGGSSKDPIDLLKGAGVDMSSKEPIEEALLVFKELLDELEKLLSDIKKE